MRTPEQQVINAGNFTMADFCEIDDAAEKLKVATNLDGYRKMGFSSWRGCIIPVENKSPEFYTVHRELNGLGLNIVAYACAPHKMNPFGLDTDDIISDYERLFQLRGKEVFHDHTHLPNWDVYEKHSHDLMNTINSYRHSRRIWLKHSVVPILGWTVNPETGRRKWLPEVEKRKAQTLIKTLSLKKGSLTKINPIAGLLYLASFSPQESASWHQYYNFAGEGQSSHEEKFRDMDPAQTFALVAMKADELLNGQTCLRVQERMLQNAGLTLTDLGFQLPE